eukprot:CAMPEP_0198141192 /NCGR_PEP_ID=MMETSP1443-20131203/4226_1 /TAXON_ID=186043 /ORGANISM="Entomoneis sp., Strain CCMP2396" /LENGTH=514 /DNA_ID=CAMNT_0043803845 /DNA_START=41 /DNA_END=1585 /DNA_ORIENTATION=+
MKFVLSFLLSLALVPQVSADDVILSRHIMELANYTAYLSSLAYEEAPSVDPDMDYLKFFDAEPDQALVIKRGGYCFGVFRGTTMTWDDWSQNLEVGNHEICADDTDEKTCCTTRVGFWHCYDTEYKNKMESALKECAETCDNMDECVVLTGHSQGGAAAAVAGVVLASLNPYVFTFGQPATILSPCERVNSERWYRWVNTKDSETLNSGIAYDPVPFAPGMGADFFGHMILISSDDTGVAYVGLNAQQFFGPLNVNGFEAHNMYAPEGVAFPGYADRISKIMELYDQDEKYPVRANGFIPGSYCTEDVECETKKCERETGLSWKQCVGTECDSDDDCDTDRCDSGICMPKLGSCQVCDEDSDCESGTCSWRFRCAATKDGLMGDECLCNINSDCESGRCEGFKPPICEARLGDGARCNEHSDCISEKCSWRFKCVGDEAPAVDRAIPVVEEVKSSGISIPSEEEEPDEPETNEKSGIIVVSAVAGAVIIGCLILNCWYQNRRRGYEEIPTNLNV